MRAKQLVARLSLEQVRALAAEIGSASDASEVVRTMQGEGAYEIAAGSCVSAVMNEDLMLLCANPFDTVAADELADPAAFEAIGLIALSGDEYAVNIDMALSASSSCSVEFGFAATLIARLAPEERTIVARAMEIGPRPSAIDTTLDAAETLCLESTVMKHVAFLRTKEREVLRQALELGELPDDLTDFPLDSSPPMVTLDQGEAGKRGLVYWVEHEPSGVDARPVIPLEVAEFLPKILEQVPPPPEVVASKSRRRKPTSTTRRPAAKKEAAPKVAPAPVAAPTESALSAAGRTRDPFARADRSGASRNPFSSRPTKPLPSDASTGSGVFSASDSLAKSGGASPFGPGAANSPYRLGRVTGIQAASALVDMETAKVAAAVMKDAELAESVMEVVADSLVLLRPGVDAQEWAENCAVRLGL
ncbi:MAG: hypothetical protein ACJAYU_000727 [Bradymonadia bacterium]|jgi:hypothetical protein